LQDECTVSQIINPTSVRSAAREDVEIAVPIRENVVEIELVDYCPHVDAVSGKLSPDLQERLKIVDEISSIAVYRQQSQSRSAKFQPAQPMAPIDILECQAIAPRDRVADQEDDRVAPCKREALPCRPDPDLQVRMEYFLRNRSGRSRGVIRRGYERWREM